MVPLTPTLTTTLTLTLAGDFESLEEGGELAGEHVTPTARWRLSDLSLSVRPGQLVVVLGQMGSGKSSVLKVIPILANLANPSWWSCRGR